MQRFVPIEDLFKGRHFDREIIILCVSWYMSFKLRFRDLVIMMADRRISVPYYDPAVGSAVPSRIRKSLVPLRSASWRVVRMDETYIKVSGQ
jgi:transposase-like protein